MKIPLLDLKAHHDPIKDEILRAIERVLESARFVLGPEAEALEQRIAVYCQTSDAIGVSSGTDALLLALMAVGIEPGDEVITSAFSFFATAGVIARLGAKPVFVDIDAASYAIDPVFLEQAITQGTKAIIPVHLYGQCADMAPIVSLAERHRLPIIEDAAQAIGAECQSGKRAGGMGAMGCLSFYPSKNLGAMGEAGMVVTNDSAMAERMKILRDHGSKPKYEHHLIGGNFRLDAIQAAVLNVKFNYLDRWTAQRQANALRYEKLFTASGLRRAELVRLPQLRDAAAEVGRQHIYHQYVIRVGQRDQLRDYLARQGIASEVYYPIPLHRQPCFRYLGYQDGDFPNAERAARETLALPMYPELREDQQQAVVDAIQTFFGAAS